MPIKTAQVRFAKEKLLVLERYVGSSDDPKFFVHFSFFNKVGINPRSGFDTPNGFYGYPLTNEIFKQLISGKLPFAQERPYIHVFSYGGELLNLKHYGNGQFQSDMRKLISNNKVTEDEAKRFASEARNPSPSGKFWNITRMIANGPNRWNALFQWLGYGGVVDLGLGIIHPQEPEQMVIFDTPGIIQVKTMINPYVSRLTPDYTNHNLDKQDYEDASRKKRLNTYDDSDYETDIPPDYPLKKVKAFLGASYNSSKPTLDYRQLLDARRIEEAFSNDEIQIMINPDFFDDPNISDSFAKNVLRIVYSNLYTDNEIINSFLILSYDDPDDEYKKIPIPNLIRALNHIGYSGLAKIINEYMRSLKSNEKSNLIELLKKSFSDIASKRSVPSFEKKILMEIFSSSPNDDYNLFSWIEPLKMTNKRSVISQILGGAANKEYIVKREEFFKKIGGPSGLSESERLDYLNGISFYIGLQREFINPPFMKDTAFVHFMKNKPWFNVRFLGNKYAFWLVTGNMIESEEERRAYLDNFGKK